MKGASTRTLARYNERTTTMTTMQNRPNHDVPRAKSATEARHGQSVHA